MSGINKQNMEQILVVFFKYVMRIEPMAFDPHLPKKKAAVLQWHSKMRATCNCINIGKPPDSVGKEKCPLQVQL